MEVLAAPLALSFKSSIEVLENNMIKGMTMQKEQGDTNLLFDSSFFTSWIYFDCCLSRNVKKLHSQEQKTFAMPCNGLDL